MVYIVLGFALIALIDLPTLLRERAWRDVAAFLVLFLPALAIALMIERGAKVPSAMRVLGEALKSMGLSY